MFTQLQEMYARDWNVLMAAASSWLHGGNPYGALRADWAPGAYAYPPTTLPWLALIALLGGFSFYIWTGLQFYVWWRLIRNTVPTQLLLICWAPLPINCISGQTTLAVVLLLWAAYRAGEKGWKTKKGTSTAFWWGMALSITSMKPQVALFPVLYLLWQYRQAAQRWQLAGGIVAGLVAAALPPTLANPQIWSDWLVGVQQYRKLNTLATPWQEPLALVMVMTATYLWYRSRRGGWQWWLPAALLPQNAVYSMLLLMPAMRPQTNYWSIAGLAMAGVLVAPVEPLTLPFILASQLLAVWMITGGPKTSKGNATAPTRVSRNEQ